MLQITRLIASDASIAAPLRERARKLVLTSGERARTRQRVRLSDGSDAALMLPRGTVLRPGAMLIDENGALISVSAAAERIYRVCARPDSESGPADLQRAAYHLGNRHVPVELAKDVLKIERDPVLRDLLLRLGLSVIDAFEPFVPEAGAYGGGHRHDHDETGGSVGEALSREAHGEAGARPHVHGPNCGHGIHPKR